MANQDLFQFKVLPLKEVLLFTRITNTKFSKSNPESYSTTKYSLLVPLFCNCNIMHNAL